MRTLKAWFGLLAGCLFACVVQAEESATGMSLEVTGGKPGEGQVIASVFGSEDEYLKTPLREAVASVDEDGVAHFLFPSIAEGEYAIAVIYDENENGKMDTRWFGIPKERFGFSNNAPARFGPASWTDARFVFEPDGPTLQISLTGVPEQ